MASMMRQPRATVALAGTAVVCFEAEVNQTKQASASTFTARFPLSTLDAAGRGLDWLASQSSVDVSISFSTGPGDGVLMISGSAEKAVVTFSAQGQQVIITGSDPTAKMTDVKTNEKFVNQKSEDIARTIAGRRGLGFQSDGGTVTAGSIYTEEQAKVTGGQSEWTLIRQLAAAEGKVAFVMGNTLHFQAPSTSSGTYPVFIQSATPGKPAASNAVTVNLGRNFKVAGGASVTFSSWDHKKQQLVTAKAASSMAGSLNQLQYVYNDHHLTQEAADKAAPAALAEIMRHEFDMSVTMPGDPTLTPLFQIDLSGTNSSFDQTYDIDNIRHVMTAANGYTMTISTKAAKKDRNSSSKLPL